MSTRTRMKRRSGLLLAALVCGGAALRAELVGSPGESIFYVDGLVADGLEPGSGGEYFHAEMRKLPKVYDHQPRIRTPSGIRMSLSIAAPPSGRALDHARAAEIYMEQQDWSRALRELQKGLDFEPDNMVLLRRAAAVSALARKFGAADEYFRRVVDAYPDNATFIAARAGVLLRLLRLGEAGEMVDRALAIEPNNLTARFNGLCIQIAQGEADVAREGWDALTLAEILRVANWLDADAVDYETALSEEGFNRLCDIVLGTGTRDHLRSLVDLLRQWSLAFRFGQWEEAEAISPQLRELGVHAMGVDMNAARMKYQRGEKGAAVEMLRGLAERYPDSLAVMYNYGFVLLETGHYELAIRALEKALELGPKDMQTEFALASAYAASGDQDRAWPVLSRLAQEDWDRISGWLEGDKPYLEAIRNDPRYRELASTAGAGEGPPEAP